MTGINREVVNLYLDDCRPAPEGFILAKSVDECIKIMSVHNVDILSLDHDLGEGRPTGYNLVKWMITNAVYPERIVLHTSNPVGRENMRQLLERYKPGTVKLYAFPVTFKTKDCKTIK